MWNRCERRWTLSVLLMALASAAGAQGAAPVSPAPARAGGEPPTEACQAALLEAINASRGPGVGDVQVRQTVLVPAASSEGNEGWRGNGSYRDAKGTPVAFTFNCTIKPGEAKAAGVVFRDARSDARAAPAQPAWNPDLMAISPQACDSAVAAHLKTRYPHMGPVRLEPSGRQLRAGPAGRSVLVGQAEVSAVAGMKPHTVVYECEMNSQDGRVVAVRTQ